MQGTPIPDASTNNATVRAKAASTAGLREVAGSQLGRGDVAALCAVLAVACWLAFANLDAQVLWQDEAQSALLSRTTLEHGVPLGTDGRNFFSQEEGVEYDASYRWRWHTWLHFYLVAGSFALLGETTAAARVPGAFFGVASVLGVFALGWTWWRNRLAAYAAAVSLLAFVPFWILARQCRYYSMTAFFAVLALLGHARLVQGRRGAAALYIVAVFALFHSHYVYVPPLVGAILLHGWIFDRARFGALARATAVALVLCLPWIVWQSGMDYPATYVDELANPSFWLRSASLFARKALAHVSGTALLLGGAAVAAGLLLREGTASLRAAARDPGAAALVLGGGAIWATLSVVAPDAFFRYLAPLLPLIALASGALIALARRVHVGLAIAIASGVIALQPVSLFAAELTNEFDGPIEGLVTYLGETAAPDDSVWITYGDMPLKFYLRVRVIGGLTGEDLDAALKADPPDWIVLRQHTISEPRDGAVRAFIEREIDLSAFQKIELPFTDTPFENREEPGEHRFRSARGGPPVAIYSRRRPHADDR